MAAAADGELFLYPGDQHLFVDSSLAAYDAEATALMTQRVLDFLAARCLRPRRFGELSTICRRPSGGRSARARMVSAMTDPLTTRPC